MEKKDFSQIKLEDLAPKDVIKKSEEYCKAIDWAIENKKVFNIALTGPYGAGKSSILRAYEKKNIRNQYVNISLASFYEINKKNGEETGKEKVKESKGDDSDIEIEKGILQQLFYKIDSKRIPYTRFRKIRNTKIVDMARIIVLLSITICLAGIIFKPNIIKEVTIPISELYGYVNNIFLMAAIYILFMILVFYNIVRLIKYSKVSIKLSSLKFEKAEIGLDKENTESIFNKHLDEILYFFEVTKYNVVVIEDLDRFNNTRIFTKLRELNQLINNYEKIKRRIVFIYAIKDDMFKNDERTKFFDFIIPVIPVINSVNAGDILLEKIKQDSLGDNISNEFINGVSVYIEDMRILTNIYNEYILYKSILTDITLKAENILALVIYKNLYPTDFSELQFNRGQVYKAFENKKEVIENKESELNNEISKLESKLLAVESEYLSSIQELKGVFLNWISEGKIQFIEINECDVTTFLSDQYDMREIFNKDSIRYKYYQNGSGWYNAAISIKELDKKTRSKYTFKERFENMGYKKKANEDKLKMKIQDLKNGIKGLKSLKLKELIEKFGANYVLKEELIKEKPLVYLLRHGKIDETYMNYLTYFYENNLTAKDMNFILGIRNYESQSFDYELTKIEQIIHKLNETEFEQKEILNFKLFESLLKNKEKYRNQLNIFIKQLSDEDEVSISFIDEFIEYITDKQEEYDFWNNICKSWNRLWTYINNYCNYPKEKVDGYLFKIIRYVDNDTIKKLNIEDDLKRYIENSKEFLPMASKVDSDKIKDLIKALNINFNFIEIINVDMELLNYIWDGCYYNINKNIIHDILRMKCNEDIINIMQMNYTTINNSGYGILIDYVKENILDYVENVFLDIEENTYESKNNIIELLNLENAILSKEIKIKIIHKEKFELSSLEEVPKELWSDILTGLKAEITWDNVSKYYENAKILDDTLIEYLNNERIYTTLALSKCENTEENSALFKLIIESDDIGSDSFSELVKSICWRYTRYDTSLINDTHMDILIDNSKFKFNVENYESIRKNFSDKHIRFINLNFNEFINNIEKYTTDDFDLYKILTLPTCTIESKKRIISKINNDLSNIDNYLRVLIYDLVVTNEEKISLGDDLYWEIFNNIDEEKKIELLCSQCSELGKGDIDKSLNDLGKQFSKISLPGSREKIKYSESIFKLASCLEKCDYISSKSIIEGKVGEKYVQFNARRK
ncbi:hypothetical protein [Clostridium folliculivorans]|uniref:YobI family P-loop NTPase n=1 Tax=Clostridium folliculivorans TaxID=2886038 RepID=UPI0021C2B917|nr:hypothetical protein [Clostridium folliculivorans]